MSTARHEFTLSPNPADASRLPPTPREPVHFSLISYLLGLLTSLLLVGGSQFLLSRPDPAPIVLHAPPTAAPTLPPPPTATPAPMTVFVSGAVQQPGLYNLPATARVGDAIVSAGGVTIVANVALINQAEKLWDGAQVHVPEIPALAVEAIAPQPPVGISGVPASPAVAPVAGANGAPTGQINLNTATAAELESLPSIGPSKAEAIIANRPYATVDELDKVPGIGPSTLEQLRPLVSAP